MKINWFSPFPAQKTDVAQFSRRMAAPLMEHFDVTFCADLPADQSELPPEAKFWLWSREEVSFHSGRSRLFEAVNIFNIGNDAQYHRGIVELALRVPGVLLMHDTRLHNLFFERSRHDKQPFQSYLDLSRALYGFSGASNARRIIDQGGTCIDQYVERMPFVDCLFEPRCDGALSLNARCLPAGTSAASSSTPTVPPLFI